MILGAPRCWLHCAVLKMKWQTRGPDHGWGDCRVRGCSDTVTTALMEGDTVGAGLGRRPEKLPREGKIQGRSRRCFGGVGNRGGREVCWKARQSDKGAGVFLTRSGNLAIWSWSGKHDQINRGLLNHATEFGFIVNIFKLFVIALWIYNLSNFFIYEI